MVYPEDLENINLYCFDIKKNYKSTKIIHCTLLANYLGQMYFAEIEIETNYYCEWENGKWVVCKNEREIIDLGLECIVDMLNEGKEIK